MSAGPATEDHATRRRHNLKALAGEVAYLMDEADQAGDLAFHDDLAGIAATIARLIGEADE